MLQIAPPPPPRIPTKEEIKALKKRDHQVLNMLKIQIQPIMDQINKKYRKFRVPVIAQSQIQYLYDEKDPQFVRPDIPQFRPFELGTDKHGVTGLRETSSGKFFYNLETTTIEERLSNGFYARPKDFYNDIKSLAKDAKHIGDKARTLAANELLTNVFVDIAAIEALPAFADCENIYRRQLQRAKDNEAKLKRLAAAEKGFEPLPQPNSGVNSQHQSSGPLTIGIPGSRPITISTPPRSSGDISNGIDHTHASNGTSVPSRVNNDDVQMGGTSDQDTSQRMQPPNQQWPRMSHVPSNLSGYATGGQSSQFSQRSGFQEVPNDGSPTGLVNDASTTTSGKKTSEGWSTQATNGVSHPESSPVERPGGDSQLPDTQGNSSQANDTQMENSNSNSDGSWPHSQAHGIARGILPSQTPSSGNPYSQNPLPPMFHTPALPAHSRLSTSRPASINNIQNLINHSPIEPISSQLSSQGKVVEADELFTNNLLKQLTEGSSGCSVEQLEQINRELMEKLWELRGELNRNLVATKLIDVFNETIVDIEEMQRVLQASQPDMEGLHSQVGD